MLTGRDYERLVLENVLVYGAPAARLLLSEQDHPLQAESFNFGEDTYGLFQHNVIWAAITEIVYKAGKDNAHIDLSVAHIASYFPERIHVDYLKSLITSGTGLVQLGTTVNPESLLRYASFVFRSGQLRNAQSAIERANLQLTNMDGLLNEEANVDDVLGNLLTELFQVAVTTDDDYQPIGVAITEGQQTLEYLLEGTNPHLLTTGWPSFDDYNLLPRGQLTVVQGESSVGKSQLAFQWALGVAIHLKAYDLPGVVAINSVEMSQQMLGLRLACALAGVDWHEVQRNPGTGGIPKLVRAGEFLRSLPIVIDDASTLTTAQLKVRAAKLNMQHGPIHLIVTDYGQLMSDSASSKVESVTNIFRNQKALAKELGCAIVAVSQVTLNPFNKTRLPAPDESRWSKDIMNDADVLMSVWNPQVYLARNTPFEVPVEGLDLTKAHIFIQKHRNGRTGIIHMDWIAKYTRFSDPALAITQDEQGTPLYRDLIYYENKWQLTGGTE